MYLKYYIVTFLFLAVLPNINSQQFKINDQELFEVEVRVVNKNNNQFIKNVQISVNAFVTTSSNINGVYKVKARVHDELVARHPDFETVRYIIKSDEEIKIVVEGLPKESKNVFFSFNKKKKDIYIQLVDSANFYKEKDLDKSLCFIEEALEENQSQKRNANTYKILADIYFYWKQYDIAISNYKISLQIYEKTETLLQLAKTQFLAKKYNESKETYKKLKNKKLSAYDKVYVLQGLGDALLILKEFEEARKNYEEGLKIAENKSINEFIPDLNSKIASVYAKQGNLIKANSAYSNTLKIASEDSERSSLEVKQEVADFLNETMQYDDEIKLRKEILERVDRNKIVRRKRKKEIKKEEKSEEKTIKTDSLTSQKLNYKIGNAYVLKEAYPEAIEYLEKSIEEADEKEDLEVQKHATRKLSEVYSTVGDYIKALKTYREFVDIVDTLYIKKEQEIYQIKRLTKKIADNQSRIAILEKDKELSVSKINVAIKDKELTVEKSKKQQIAIYSLIGGLILMSLLTFYKHRANQKQQLANNLLALKSMRSQMNPHFIFNALNSVNSFIAVNDERNANRYLSEFSALMRSVLENSDEDFILFTKEIELLELYVKLEHNRFQDKFDYEIYIDKTIEIDEYRIPPMLLQPYIENAIWHGLRYRKEKGNLTISIRQKEKDAISICIQDDGIGRKKSLEMKTKNQLKQKSKGMSTIKNRIAILNDMYQDKISVQISDLNEDGSGTKVELTLKK